MFVFGSVGDICPAGHFCPKGSKRPQPCTLGYYCQHAGLPSPTAQCSEGFYCNDSSSVPNQYQCPPGYYCTKGTGVPYACPRGTFSNTHGNVKEGDCRNCTAGKYCAGTGLDKPTSDCDATYYCPGGQDTGTPIGLECPEGHYCPGGSGAPRRCESGKFQNEKKTSSCKICPEGYYCNTTLAAVITPVVCEVGHYCPPGTGNYRDYPCPESKYSFTHL